MPQPTTFFVPFPLAGLARHPQEPKVTSDTPAGPATTAIPGAPGGTGPSPTPAPAGPCGGNEMMLYMGLFLALMYFMVMRPEQKRRKEQMALLGSVKQGDRVVTSGGMHGIVAKLTEKTVTLRVDTLMMTFDRTAISRVERDEAQGSDATKT